MTTTTVQVQGMTCDHCVAAVRDEVSQIDEVTDVAVDVTSGEVVIASNGPLDEAAVRAAIDEAGFEMA